MSSNPNVNFKVAIVGRPNVGKSTLFNILTDSRKAVVKNQPGVTRDIQIEAVEWRGLTFDLIDTGGVTESPDFFSRAIREQVQDLLGAVDLILVVFDGRDGLCTEDTDLFRMVQAAGKPFRLIVNKIDQPHRQSELLTDFYKFGEDLLACSFEQRFQVDEILEWVHSHLNKIVALPTAPGTRLAIVGKPNAGKSSLVNRILGQNRMLVSEIAGTTVDAVEIPFQHNDRNYVLIDTAGLRRKKSSKEDLEIIASFKSHEAIARASLILLVVDAEEKTSEQDAKIIQYALERHKGVILVANKVDRANEVAEFRKKFRTQIESDFHFFPDIPIVFVSALTGKGMDDLYKAIELVWDKMEMRIPTRELNDFFFEVIRKAPAPVHGSQDVKFFYLTQTRQTPPSFIAFVNHPDGLNTGYRRFLSKQIKERWDLSGIPIRIFAMKRGRDLADKEHRR